MLGLHRSDLETVREGCIGEVTEDAAGHVGAEGDLLKPLASSRALVPTSRPSAPHLKTLTCGLVARRDRRSRSMSQFRTAWPIPAAPPGGIEKSE